MENKVVKTMISAVALSGVAFAGTAVMPGTSAVAPAAAGFCGVFDTLGSSVYEGGFINSVKFSGRAHLNGAYTEGDVNGTEFDAKYAELRRLRIGTQVQFLNDFTLVASANLSDGGKNDISLGYNNMDELYLQYSFGNTLGLEDVSVAVGRQKLKFSAEGSTSSNTLKTVERSVIANHFYGGLRPTGVQVKAKSGSFKGALGVFSTDTDSQEFEFGAIYGSLAYDCSCGGTLTLQGVYNDVEAGSVDRFGYDWASSLAYTNKFGNWDLLVNGIYGSETSGDNTYGVVVMPSTYIIADTLEVVARYEYAKSDGDNLSLSRYAKAAGRPKGVKFEERHALYAGLNYYLCGNNTKVQLGAEYETAEHSSGADADATTLWLGLRTKF